LAVCQATPVADKALVHPAELVTTDLQDTPAESGAILESDGPGTIPGYSFSKLNVNKDGHLTAPVSVCFKGGTQWWRHAKGNFAHMVRGLVVPAYSMMRQNGFLHPDVQIYFEEDGADHKVIRDAFSMFMTKPLQKAHCDPTVHTHVMAFDETEFLEKASGVGVVRGDASCSALKKDMFSDVFHAMRRLNPGKVQLRADRPKMSVYVSKRSSGRDLSDWDVLVSQLRSKEGLAVETGDIGSLPFQEQVLKAANTDIMIMHHGAANNHRFWMAPDSVLIETQPPDSWFCGHAFGDDQVNYVLSMNNPQITAGECNPGQPLDQCNNADCNMYEQPKSEFAKRKDGRRSIEGSGANRIVELVGSLQAARSQGGSFKETITKFGQRHNGWTRTACRGVATQLVETDDVVASGSASTDGSMRSDDRRRS